MGSNCIDSLVTRNHALSLLVIRLLLINSPHLIASHWMYIMYRFTPPGQSRSCTHVPYISYLTLAGNTSSLCC